MITSNRCLSRLAVFLLFFALVLAAPDVTAMTWHQVGGTASSSTASNSPNAFSFMDQTGLAGNSSVTSNTIVLTGSFSNITAYCPDCYIIYHNATSSTAKTMTGFNPGDTLKVTAVPSIVAGATRTISITINGTTGTWNLTTNSNCATGDGSITTSSNGFGTTCSDGSVFVGTIADGSYGGGAATYAMPCDLGKTGTARNCSGTAALYAWGPTGTTESVDLYHGKANTTTLAALGASYAAATACKNQTYGGHNDWYLPSRQELYYALYQDTSSWISGNIGPFIYDNTQKWTSSVTDTTMANSQINSGSYPTATKTTAYAVRCFRHD